MGRFQEYVSQKEKAKLPVISKIKLNRAPGAEDFQPFTIDKNNHQIGRAHV